jgi:ABC-type transport system involved in multi-copper enzyme maturation permease subunit
VRVKLVLDKLRPGVNPIVVKELRSRMRGARAFAILTVVLLLLAGVSYGFYRIALAAMAYSSTPISPQIGRVLLVVLAMVELLMVCFITPAVTGGAISGEVERLTYEMLLATPLRPASILWGKLVSALGYVFLLILAALPMASLIFIFGGVTLRDLIVVLVILAATAVTLGVIGVTLSAWLRRTVRATMLGYLAVLGLLVGPFIVYILVAVLLQDIPPSWILILNPVSALFSTLPAGTSRGDSVFALFELSRLLGGTMGIDAGSVVGPVLPRPLYHYTLPAYGLLSLSLYLLATRLVRPTRRWRIRWQEALIALAMFFGLGLAVALPFVLTAGRYELRADQGTPPSFSVEVRPLPPRPEVMIEREVVILEGPRVSSPIPTPTPTPTPTPAPESRVPTGAPAATSQAMPETPSALPEAADDIAFHQAPGLSAVCLLRHTEGLWNS